MSDDLYWFTEDVLSGSIKLSNGSIIDEHIKSRNHQSSFIDSVIPFLSPDDPFPRVEAAPRVPNGLLLAAGADAR